jgi:hypothetical protein
VLAIVVIIMIGCRIHIMIIGIDIIPTAFRIIIQASATIFAHSRTARVQTELAPLASKTLKIIILCGNIRRIYDIFTFGHEHSDREPKSPQTPPLWHGSPKHRFGANSQFFPLTPSYASMARKLY